MKNISTFKLILILLSLGLFNNIKAQTDFNFTTNYQGYSRSFRVHIPPGYMPSQPIPLVLVFHGSGVSNSLEIKNRTRFHLIGDTANFITIFPQALFGSWADSRGNPADLAGVDDVGFTNHILDTMESVYNIDITRIYAAGMSTGGVFSQRLALQSTYRIAAIASVGASLFTSLMPYFPPSRKVPVLYMNGTADTRNLYYGGMGLSPGTSINTDTAAANWASFGNCFGPPSVYDYPNTNMSDNSTVTRFTYFPCQSCSEVVLYRINNGGHTWPGGFNNSPQLGTVNNDISGSHEIWSFFRRHRLVCSGIDAGSNIIDIIQTIGLSNGLENSLTVKIENALASCEDGNEIAAINQLNAFINQVNAKRGNGLTTQEADQLIAYAQALMESILNGTAGCGLQVMMSAPYDNGTSSPELMVNNADYTSFETTQDALEGDEILYNNYADLTAFPNPAKGNISFQYFLPGDDQVSFIIYDQFGKEVISLMDHERMPGGYNKLTWICGSKEGIFLARLISDSQQSTSVFILNK